MKQILLVLTILLAFGLTVGAQEPAGTITKIIGEPKLRHAAADWKVAAKGKMVYDGDQLQTGANSKVEVVFVDGTALRLNRNSLFTVTQTAKLKDGYATDTRLDNGQLWFNRPKGPGQLKLETPVAVAAVKGTQGDLQVGISGDTTLIVLDGQVEFSSALVTVLVNEMQRAIATQKTPPLVEAIKKENLPTWQKELAIEPDSKRVIIDYRDEGQTGQIILNYKKK